jgi:hypothetical protein
MTERSRPWDGTIVGDAFEAPYDAATEFARVLRALVPAAEQSAHKGGVVNGASGFSDYGATSGANQVTIASGIGFVQGTWHESDANVVFAIATPVTATRVDRIVLRKSWASQTIRLTRIAGTEGAGVPLMTQIFGTTWDVPLHQVSITTASIITITDERVSLLIPTHTHTTALTGGAVAHASLSGITVNDHHTQTHLHNGADGSGTVSHTTLSNIGSNAHTAIDTHIAANIIGAHGVSRLNTTGTQSLGSPTDGKIVFARANGGTLTVTTPSGAIFIGTAGGASSVNILNGNAYTLIADGTNWYLY